MVMLPTRARSRRSARLTRNLEAGQPPSHLSWPVYILPFYRGACLPHRSFFFFPSVLAIFFFKEERKYKDINSEYRVISLAELPHLSSKKSFCLPLEYFKLPNSSGSRLRAALLTTSDSTWACFLKISRSPKFPQRSFQVR